MLHSGETGLPTDNLQHVTIDRSEMSGFPPLKAGLLFTTCRGCPAVREITDPGQKLEEIILYLNDTILQPDVPLSCRKPSTGSLRIISESLGATVNWDSSSGKIEVELDGKKLGLTVGSTRLG